MTINRRAFGTGLGLLGAATTTSAIMPTALAQTSTSSDGESTWDRIQRTKTVRVSGIAGEEPGFHKDITTGEWSGSQIAMARDIA